MSDAELAARVKAAREFDHVIDGVTFRMRLPTPEALRIANARLDDEAPWQARMSAALALALVAIQGATERDIGLDSDAPLASSAYAAREFVANRLDVADALALVLYERMRERGDRIEGDRKN